MAANPAYNPKVGNGNFLTNWNFNHNLTSPDLVYQALIPEKLTKISISCNVKESEKISLSRSDGVHSGLRPILQVS